MAAPQEEMIRPKDQALSILACAFYLLSALTIKIRKINEAILLKEKESHGNVLFAFWHGRQFLLILAHRFRGIYTMTSLSRDGDLQTAIVSKLGYRLVRGSAGKRGAVQGTLNMIEKVKEGHDAAFTVDGPAGPGFEVKEGILYVAKKTKCPIIPLSCSAKRRRLLNNWDRYLVPYPFNSAVIIYGNPVRVNENDDLEAKAVELKNELERLTLLADGMAG